jgi:hypothetical protein
MVETDSDQTNISFSDVKVSVKQRNGIGPREPSTRRELQPAIIQTTAGTLVPFTTKSDKHQIVKEDQYRPFDPEKGDALTQSFHQLPPPYSNGDPTKADFETAIGNSCDCCKFIPEITTFILLYCIKQS